MAFRLIAIFSLIAILPAVAKNAHAEGSKWATGSWGWVSSVENDDGLEKYTCSTKPLSIKLDLERKRYSAFRDGDDPISGNILRYGQRMVVIQYDNEERLMDNGELHIWGMFFYNQDEFVWIRQDWMNKDGTFKSTQRLERCLISIS